MSEKGKIGSTIIRLHSVDSTNAYLKRIAGTTPPGTLVIAEEQTAGRGRRGRTWLGHRGKSLLMSFLLSPALDADMAPLHLMWPAAATVAALESFGVNARIKWPNDILLQGKKIGGVLVESVTRVEKTRLIIVGIGLNLHQQAADFPDDLASSAGSVAGLAGVSLDRDDLLEAMLASLNDQYLRLCDRGPKMVQQIWLQKCCHINKRLAVFTDEHTIEGVFAGIDEHGFALIKNEQGIQRITTFNRVLLREDYVTSD